MPDATRLYRAMRIDTDGLPLCGNSARSLGVRTQGEYADIKPDVKGYVTSGHGGMSVSPHSPRNLPLHRRPPALGGIGRDPVFVVLENALGRSLSFRPDPKNPAIHGFVEPACRQHIESYREALCETRTRWEKHK